MARRSSWSSSSSGGNSNSNNGNKTTLADFCQYVPLRLSAEERALLTVLENTLHVSEYTDHVDVASSRRGLKARRILEGILEACHISTGLAIASGHEQSLLASTTSVSETTSTPSSKKQKKKKSLRHKKKSKKKSSKESETPQQQAPPPSSTSSSWAGRNPKDNAVLFQTMFEIGRRNKVLNPSQMRTTYGKLMYLLQDAQNPSVAKSLGFSLYKDLILVGPFLQDRGGEALLQDTRLVGATRYITDRNEATGQRLERSVVEERIAEKHALQQELIKEYSTDKLSAEDVVRCIESISDAICVVEINTAPVQRMLQYLENNFDPNRPGEYSLQLSGGSRYASSSNSYTRYGFSSFSGSSGGPTLSHSHATQYTFVWQSLRLWHKVQRHMHKLWVCADDDLLSTSTSYHLYNTGQGLNRVQACPRVGKVMRSLLHQTQQEAGSPWVGLSVIHLGDRDVPNALVFIDKYTQIPRFLNPICDFVDSLSSDNMIEDERVSQYIENQFESPQRLKMLVLQDYFKHGFDGSGDDGGSCIDGRLTSSWNWTSRISKKSYYHALMLVSGFQGFDGEFK